MARVSLQQIQDNAPPGTDPWLTPQALAELCGLDVKWLAAAREGRKAVRGPAYVKLGEGRTSPVRYPLSAVIAWMQSFQVRDTTVMYRESGPWPASLVWAIEHAAVEQPGTSPGTGPIPQAPSFKAWLNSTDSTECWPMVETKLGLMDAFKAMAAAGKPENALDGVQWVPRAELQG